jgi:hypothetical protein
MASRTNILKIGEFDSSNLVTSTPKPLGKQGGKSVSINYKFSESQGLITLQTPWMRSYGIGKWIDEKNPDAPAKLSVCLSFGGIESDKKIEEFHTFLEELDQWAIDTVHKNSWSFLQVKNVPKETIAFNFNTSFKTPRDKSTGEPTGKPDYMKLKINLGSNGYNVVFFDKEKTRIDDSEVESKFVMLSQVKALLQCTGFWIVNGKYGLTWNLKQIVIDPPAKIGKEYAFCDEEELESSKDKEEYVPKEEFQVKAIELPESDEESSKKLSEKKVIRKVVSAKK